MISTWYNGKNRNPNDGNSRDYHLGSYNSVTENIGLNFRRQIEIEWNSRIKIVFSFKKFSCHIFLPYLHLYGFVFQFQLGTDSEQVEYKPLPGGPSSGTQKETEKDMEQEVLT